MMTVRKTGLLELLHTADQSVSGDEVTWNTSGDLEEARAFLVPPLSEVPAKFTFFVNDHYSTVVEINGFHRLATEQYV